VSARPPAAAPAAARPAAAARLCARAARARSAVAGALARARFRLLRARGRDRRPRAVAGVVFSKDRPLQLHALLASYFARVRRPAPLWVLYTTSGAAFDAAYAEVAAAFAGRPVTWCRERAFRADLLALLDALPADRVVFFVDDLVVLDAVDLVEFADVDPAQVVPSLRLGLNIRRRYETPLPPPPFVPGPGDAAGRHYWRWRDGVGDWGYPMSVDGHLFATAEVGLMARLAPFAAPNSFERALTGFAPCFAGRYGACYPRSKILNIPWNRVQHEHPNRAGQVSEHALLARWREGLELDLDALEGFVNESVHQEVPLVLRPRRR